MMKGGNEGVRTAPAKMRTILSGNKSQCENMEWRCLSFLEARMLAEAGRQAIGSSGASAELNCAAFLLMGEMVPFCAVRVAHGI